MIRALNWRNMDSERFYLPYGERKIVKGSKIGKYLAPGIAPVSYAYSDEVFKAMSENPYTVLYVPPNTVVDEDAFGVLLDKMIASETTFDVLVHGRAALKMLDRKLAAKKPPTKLLVVDLHNLLYRAYFSRNEQYAAINAVLSLLFWINEQNYSHVIFASERIQDPANIRKSIYPRYKSGRKEPPEDLVRQIGAAEKTIFDLGYRIFKIDGYEADDIIFTVVKQSVVKHSLPVDVLSSDKDLLSLLVYNNMKKDMVLIMDPLALGKKFDESYVKSKFGVGSSKIIDFLSLAGDPSDKIPGCPGIGPKKAAALLERYGTLNGVLSNDKKAGEHIEEIELSKRLVSPIAVPLVYDVLQCVRPVLFYKERIAKAFRFG